MTQPGMISHGMPPMADDLARRVRDLERAMEVVRGRSIQAVNLAQSAAATANGSIAAMTQFTVGTNTFAVPKSWTTIASQQVTVPAGFTQIDFYAFASVNAQNTSSATDFLTARVNGPGVGTGNQMSSANVPASNFGFVSVAQSGSLSGLTPGNHITFGLQVFCGQGWASGAANQSMLTAFLVWKP